jgi:nucleoside-diphosphate-sugar epimerase
MKNKGGKPNMKILLTGASGYIGKAFYRKFKKKHELIAPAREELDLTRVQDVIKYIKGADAVVHTARAKGANAAAEDLIMFKNLQNACSMYKIPKLIVLGSADEYDLSGDVAMAKEEDAGQTLAHSDAAHVKNTITQLARSDRFTTVLRFFEVIGKNSASGFLTDTIRAAAEGKDLAESTNRAFSVTYLLDVLRIIELFCVNDFPKGEYNCVPKKPYTKQSVLRVLYALSERTVTVKMTEKKVFEHELTASGEKLAAVLGKYRFITPRGAIKKLYVKERAAYLKRCERARIRQVGKEKRLAAAREKRKLLKESNRGG